MKVTTTSYVLAICSAVRFAIDHGRAMKSIRQRVIQLRKFTVITSQDPPEEQKPKAGWDRAITERLASGLETRLDADFMLRVMAATGTRSARQLAYLIGVKPREVPYHGRRSTMTDWDVDPFWQILLDFCDQRIAGLLALKEELERKKRMDRHRRWEREEAIRTR